MEKKSHATTHNPPVVVVLGHVDHGKTTLLDAIRKTNIAERERGGITQRIGASTIELMHEGEKRTITFIDTPGHEAFSAMRSRGAQVADIGLLIVASTEGVKPQTKESIQVLTTSQIPFIVVLTKADLPTKNSEKVKQELLKEGIRLEGYGGDVPVIEVSAKEGRNIHDLLDLILLIFDLIHDYSVSKSDSLSAVVIESKRDLRSGVLATVVVKSGILSVRDDLVCDGVHAKVKSLINDGGQKVDAISVGQAAEVLGFETIPAVGSVVKKASDSVSIKQREEMAPSIPAEKEPVVFHKDEDKLALILCADTEGSLEAIVESLPKEITLLLKKTGEVTEADVLHAKATGAIIIGFNIKVRNDVSKLALQEKVLIRTYDIIYNLLEEVKDAAEGKRMLKVERVLGVAKILATFPYEKTMVLGVKVLDGRVAKGDRVRIERGETIVGESTISSLRHGKDQVSKIEEGQEAGVLLSPFLDFTIGDMVICHG